MIFKILPIRKKNMRTTENDFSVFVIHAKASEQKQVLTRVVTAASEDQKNTIEKARKLDSQISIQSQPAY